MKFRRCHYRSQVDSYDWRMGNVMLFVGIVLTGFLNYTYYANLRLFLILSCLQVVFLIMIHYLTKKFTSNIPFEESNYRVSLKKLVIVSISILSLGILQGQVIYCLNLTITAFMCQYIAVKNGYRLAT